MAAAPIRQFSPYLFIISQSFRLFNGPLFGILLILSEYNRSGAEIGGYICNGRAGSTRQKIAVIKILRLKLHMPYKLADESPTKNEYWKTSFCTIQKTHKPLGNQWLVRSFTIVLIITVVTEVPFVPSEQAK